MSRHLILFLGLLAGLDAYKYLVISPFFGHSHVKFLGRIADTLTEAGHDVTVFMPILDTTLANKTGLKLTKKVIVHPVDPRVDQLMIDSRTDMFKSIWTMDTDAMALIRMGQNMSRMFAYSCEFVINDEALMAELRAGQFDVGIAEPFTICGPAMFEHLGLPILGATSTAQMDTVSYAMGEPLAPSYVPAMTSGNGEKMGMLDRMKNAVGTVLGMYFFTGTYRSEMVVLKEKFGQDFPDYNELLARMSYLLTNSNPFLNYPRPIIQKTVEIGGITVDKGAVATQNLGVWDSVLSERKHTVFISFGSVAKSKDMPETYKNTLLNVFSSMPDITFIWKYEEKSSMADHLPNVHLSPWLPQNALLADPRLSAFLTHGGLGSTTEVSHLGKPAIFVPLFAEQPRNAAMLARHGGAMVLEKKDLNNVNTIRNAIGRIVGEKSYTENAQKLAEILTNTPHSPKEVLVKYAEFVARFGRLSQLDPHARHLSIFQYYFIDIFVLIAVVLYTLFKLVSTICCKCASVCGRKQKTE